MSTKRANLTITKYCAFCKYWYDPTNMYISPKSPRQQIWEYDYLAKCKCMKKSRETKGGETCSNFQCKIDV